MVFLKYKLLLDYFVSHFEADWLYRVSQGAMSAALVRKALELSAEQDSGISVKDLKKSKKKKEKHLKLKKKKTPEQIRKQNLKILKALEQKTKATYNTSSAAASTPSKKKKKKEQSGFTEEDFEKFEREYFVTD